MVKVLQQEPNRECMSQSLKPAKRLAIIGGGPSALFLYKRLLETGLSNFSVDIFEQKNRLGQGMPYSIDGSNTEHITNVSGNEIPILVTSVVEWMGTVPEEHLKKYNIVLNTFHEFKVLPRLLFGDYLHDQFYLLLEKGKEAGLNTSIHLNCKVTDLIDMPARDQLLVELEHNEQVYFDHVIICTGHHWPFKHEKNIPGYFDSPYPPSKLAGRFNHTIAIRGSSLTAIDAMRTLARNNGSFVQEAPHRLAFIADKSSPDFKIIMHSLNGLLPAIRFHLDDPHLSNDSLLSEEAIACHIKENDGFLSLDFIFEKDFKEPFRKKDPAFYEQIKDMKMESFVELVMCMRERTDPFKLFKAEYLEAKESIKRKKSVYWKEMLAVLSFAMNYPAKHFSAEDMLRLKRVLMPLISIVIAFVPQSSCEEMIAMYDAGALELIPVNKEDDVEIREEGGIIYHLTDEKGEPYEIAYQTFIDCIGQPPLPKEEFPFKSLADNDVISPARLKFRNAKAAEDLLKEGSKDIEGSHNNFYLKVPGIAINDHFNIVNNKAEKNPRIYMMAVPFIAGFNPDYSGLDFCNEASKIIVDDIFSLTNNPVLPVVA